MHITPRTRRWLARLAKLALLLALIAALRVTLLGALADLENPDYRQHLPRLQPAWLAVAGLFYLFSLAPGAIFYSRVLVACGQPAGWAAVRAFYISQIGKYVPGKAMVLVLRSGLLAGRGVDATISIAAAFIETLTAMAAGSLMAVVALAPSARQYPQAILAGTAMLGLTGVAAQPALFAMIAVRLGLKRFHPAALDSLRSIRGNTLLLGWAMTGFGWWLQGLSLWAVLRSLDLGSANPTTHWPLHTAAVALGAVTGFLTMIPGGLIGRELVLTQLMAPEYGPAPAALAALLTRLVSLVSEAVIAAVFYGTWRSAPAKFTPPSDSPEPGAG